MSLGAVTHFAIVGVTNTRNKKLKLVVLSEWGHFLPVLSTNAASLLVLYGSFL